MTHLLNTPESTLPPPSEKTISNPERKELLDAALAKRMEWPDTRLIQRSEYSAVVETGSKPNHVLHVILSIITLGLWLIVWFLIAVFGGPKRSNDLGGRPRAHNRFEIGPRRAA